MIRIPPAWKGYGVAEPLDMLGDPPRRRRSAIIGEQDPYTPPDDVAALERDARATVVRYPDAEHGFVHDPDRPAHRADDAADAWQKAIAFLTTSKRDRCASSLAVDDAVVAVCCSSQPRRMNDGDRLVDPLRDAPTMPASSSCVTGRKNSSPRRRARAVAWPCDR